MNLNCAEEIRIPNRFFTPKRMKKNAISITEPGSSIHAGRNPRLSAVLLI
jgi:hypothetical protein